jgi:hypothetical protein
VISQAFSGQDLLRCNQLLLLVKQQVLSELDTEALNYFIKHLISNLFPFYIVGLNQTQPILIAFTSELTNLIISVFKVKIYQHFQRERE